MKKKSNSNGDVEVAPLLIDAKDLAKELHVSKRSLWRLRDAGKLPRPVKIGSLVRWRVEDIKEWLRDRCPNLDGRNSVR